MPVEYKYHKEDNTIRIQCRDELTIAEIREYFQNIEKDETLPKGTVEIVDLTQMSFFDLNYTDAAKMPEAYMPANLKKEIVGTILFGASHSNLAFAQLIQAYFKKSMPNHFFKTVDTVQEVEETLLHIRSL
jgi:hypothetical protein